MILRPEAVIVAGIRFDKQFGRLQPYFTKLVNNIQFMQGLLCIFIEIPDSMVEIKEDVLVLFHVG